MKTAEIASEFLGKIDEFFSSELYEVCMKEIHFAQGWNLTGGTYGTFKTVLASGQLHSKFDIRYLFAHVRTKDAHH